METSLTSRDAYRREGRDDITISYSFSLSLMSEARAHYANEPFRLMNVVSQSLERDRTLLGILEQKMSLMVVTDGDGSLPPLICHFRKRILRAGIKFPL